MSKKLKIEHVLISAFYFMKIDPAHLSFLQHMYNTVIAGKFEKCDFLLMELTNLDQFWLIVFL
jgi:hypothetical protein